MNVLRLVWVVPSLFIFLTVQSQGLRETLIHLKAAIRYQPVEQFYRLNNFSFAWIGNDDRISAFLQVLDKSDDWGLRQRDYQFAFIEHYRKGKPLSTGMDSTEAEIRFTDAAIHLFTELKKGNRTPFIGYSGYHYQPDVMDLPVQLYTALNENSLSTLAAELMPTTREFRAMVDLLTWFNKIVRDTAFKERPVTSSRVTGTNTALLNRLYQLKRIDSIPAGITDKQLADTLKKALRLFDVLADGRLRSTGLAALNVPISQRIDELKLAMNWMRWLDELRQKSVAVLNIPAAMLFVYSSDSMIIDSRMVVGKRSTPTPILSSYISEVILYPYWHVPAKIATKELLPNIRYNIEYLEENNFQVLDKQGRVVDPRSINWKSLGPGNFPYTIRQSTGCDNSLGIVKFNFYNPYSVYLHDTPVKTLFAYSKRYYSHGCMRVEKFVELAHYLLGSNRVAIDTLLQQGCVNQQSPVVIEIENGLPLFVIYSTLWFSREGELKFYDDVYGRLSQLARNQR